MSALRCSLAVLLASLFALPAAAEAGPDELKFEIDGYYRVRGHLFGNLFDKEFPKNGAAPVPMYYVENSETDIPPEFAQQFYSATPNAPRHELVDRYCRSFPAQCRRGPQDQAADRELDGRG